ncbi:MAG: L-threonylcarbamoyladenylate synthase [Rickettsiales bacterium]|jgi:L-threonylcarbamoyladenylate synthase
MTIILKESDPKALKMASEILKNDGIVCFATETVYAVACNAGSDLASKRLYEIKNRDPKKPIAVFVKNLTEVKRIFYLSKEEETIAKNFMPGMITLILKKKKIDKKMISSVLNNDDQNLGIRIPNHKFCLKLLNEFDGIIAATSANPSQKDPAINFFLATKYFMNKVDLIIDGGVCDHKIASTVLKVEGGIQVIREGLVTKNQLEQSIKNLCNS